MILTDIIITESIIIDFNRELSSDSATGPFFIILKHIHKF